ncbi:MAG TPA: hypothetical protein VF476_08515 [Chitinophagaceae bacterium]
MSEQENIVSDMYDNYSETQKEILEMEIRKTRNKLFTIAAVIFCFDLIALLIADALVTETFILIVAVPAILVGLGFLALKEPMLAIIIAAIIIIGIWIYTIVITGGMAAISGWLAKAIIIYLLIAGFQSAKEAQRIKKELAG